LLQFGDFLVVDSHAPDVNVVSRESIELQSRIDGEQHIIIKMRTQKIQAVLKDQHTMSQVLIPRCESLGQLLVLLHDIGIETDGVQRISLSHESESFSRL
jgi:hypothetical protein